ncbi:MAG: FAD-dependent oxidoreductase [Candidatus Zixiibacteriota bacterium]|nr:MAG: FAD-dependent oxidoreductase [candidate division Zixibacteria bacterium]
MSERKNLPVQIIGGGLAGLTAAIKLTDYDRQVILYDQPGEPDSAECYRSVHTTQFNLDKTCSYLDLDITGCFERVESETVYLYGRRITKSSRAYACERGNAIGSLDHTLKTIALKKGVVINYQPVATVERLSDDKTILATGLNQSAYQLLNIGHTELTGYEARMASSKRVTLTSFKDSYTGRDFAYIASKNGIVYTLLFSRNGVDLKNLVDYQDHLRQTTGLIFPRWSQIRGCVPLEHHLFKNDYILAGTLSGVIDPFFLSGVVGAMVSGRIAAMAVIDPPNALREHQRFVKNFRIKQHLYQLMQSRLLPAGAKIIVIFLHTLFRDVGKL